MIIRKMFDLLREKVQHGQMVMAHGLGDYNHGIYGLSGFPIGQYLRTHHYQYINMKFERHQSYCLLNIVLDWYLYYAHIGFN